MKRIHYYLLGIFILIFVITLSSWMGARHSAEQLASAVTTQNRAVRSALNTRYSTVISIVEEVSSTDEIVLTKIESFNTSYASYKDDDKLTKETTITLEVAFNDLVDYLVDHKDKYVPFSLTEEILVSYESATENALKEISAINININEYNTNLKVFPNIIYLSKYKTYDVWDTTLFRLTLPSFE